MASPCPIPYAANAISGEQDAGATMEPF